MAEWRTRQHLEDHYELHRRELRVRSIEEYDARAQETIALGEAFRYYRPRTREWRVGYFHRESSRFVATDIDGFIRTHHRTDEATVAGFPRCTYRG
jgi:hypothetical protein